MQLPDHYHLLLTLFVNSKVKELEEEKARWTKERGEIEMRLDESQKVRP